MPSACMAASTSAAGSQGSASATTDARQTPGGSRHRRSPRYLGRYRSLPASQPADQGRAAGADRHVHPPGPKGPGSGAGNEHPEYAPANTGSRPRRGPPGKTGSRLPPLRDLPVVPPSIPQFYRQGGLYPKDTLSGWHDPGGLRPSGFHRPSGSASTQARGLTSPVTTVRWRPITAGADWSLRQNEAKGQCVLPVVKSSHRSSVMRL